ncbi:MAG: diguanylate cyclase [Rubrivivax sp.]|nr:diguanylate cyclase [Rubrivivax sp.]
MPWRLRNPRSKTPAQRWAVAAVLFGVAVVLRLLLAPPDGGLSFSPFYPLTVLVFALCGRGPGWAVVLASLVAALGMASGSPFQAHNGYLLGGAGLYLLGSALIDAIIERLHQREQRLRTLSDDLRDVLDQQSDLIVRAQADGRLRYANPAFCRFFGVDPKLVAAQPWAPMIWPDDLAATQQALAGLGPDRPELRIEHRVRTPQGMRWVAWHCRGLFDADGRLQELQSEGRDTTERRRLEEALREQRALYEDLYDHAPCGYHGLTADGLFVHVNQTELDWLGYTREELVGVRRITDLLTDDGRRTFAANYPSIVAGQDLVGLELDLVARNGQRRRVSVSATPVFDASGRWTMSRSVLHDISDLHASRRALEQLNAEQAVMLDNELVAAARLRDRRILWCNRAMQRLFGYDEQALLGQSTRLIHLDDASYANIGDTAHAAVADGHTWRGQLQMRHRQGHALWLDMHGADVGDGESLWLMNDITELQARREAAEHAAAHDPLTGLPNRRLLDDALLRACAGAARHGHTVVVGWVDLDGFKAVNDRHGHAAGDALLLALATRLRGALRAHDSVHRVGGDEFVLLLDHLSQPDDALPVVQRALQQLAAPVALDAGPVVKVGASMGLCAYPRDAADAAQLLLNSDAAMYTAKQAGRGGVRWHGAAAAP